MVAVERTKTSSQSKMEEVQARHRKENKDLQNKITGMKKQATKSTRKEINSRCNSLQESLTEKHVQEIQELEKDKEDSSTGALNEVTPEELLLELENADEKDSVSAVEAINAPVKKRRNRQKEKLAKRDAEVQRIKEEAGREAAQQPDLKKMEQEAIDQLCDFKKLKPFDIQPDGHCLFASVLDQLTMRHNRSDLDIHQLRSLACQYMRENKEDFIPYLFNEETMELQGIDEYTKEMETTAKWGGELEILALAKSFNCPISVLMSGRPLHVVNEDSEKPELKLVYYKHSYALGEHYNSLRDV